MTTEEPLDSEPLANKGRDWTPWWILGGFVALVLLCSGVLTGGGDDDEPDETSERIDAERVCEEKFIAGRLKAPATAEYDLSVSGGPTTYTVTGTVDSENSFGAMIRSEVTCVVRDAGDQWILESLTGIN